MDKTQIAAISGVIAYLKGEKSAQKFIVEPPRYLVSASPWATYGRKRIMQMRSLIQGRYLRGNNRPIRVKASGMDRGYHFEGIRDG